MHEQSTQTVGSSSRLWERLDEFVLAHIQRFIQSLVEEKVTELLGRKKSVRRAAVDVTLVPSRDSPELEQATFRRSGSPEVGRRTR